MIEDRFYECCHSDEELEVFEDDNESFDYETLRYCDIGCNPYTDCNRECIYFQEKVE